MEWLRKESIYFDAARKEWEAHAPQYIDGTFGWVRATSTLQYIVYSIYLLVRLQLYHLIAPLSSSWSRLAEFEEQVLGALRDEHGDLSNTDIADHVLIYFMKARRVGSAIEYAQGAWLGGFCESTNTHAAAVAPALYFTGSPDSNVFHNFLPLSTAFHNPRELSLPTRWQPLP